MDCSKLLSFESKFASHPAINKINFTNCALRESPLLCTNLGGLAYSDGGYETEIILDGFLGISATGSTPILSIQSTPVTRISTKNVTFVSQSTNEWQPLDFRNLPAVETIDLSGMSLIGDNFKLGVNVFTALSNIRQIYMDIDPSRFSITTSNLFVDCPEGTEETPRTFYYNEYYDYSTIINQLPNGWNAVTYKNEPNVNTFNVETELIINANDVEWDSTSVPITYNYIEKTNINGVDIILNSAEGTDTVSIEQNSETNPVIKTISYTYLGITASVEITQSGKPDFSNYTIAKQNCVAGDILISNQSGEKYFVRGIDNFNTITALEPNV